MALLLIRGVCAVIHKERERSLVVHLYILSSETVKNARTHTHTKKKSGICL